MVTKPSRSSLSKVVRYPGRGRARQTNPITVAFQGAANEELTKLALETGRSPERLILEGLSLRREMERARKRSGRLLVEENGSYRELLPYE